MENYPLHNLGYTEPIVTTQGNYSHGPKVGQGLFDEHRVDEASYRRKLEA